MQGHIGNFVSGIINGSPSQTNRFWIQDLSVTSGQRVDFSFWAANAFPVKATIETADNAAIRAGITVEVTLLFGDVEAQAAYLIPLQAVAPDGSENKSFVFVFDPVSSTIKRTAIENGGIRDNDVIVDSGLRAGDIIAVAGVSFLSDGQKVRLLQP